MTSPLAVLYQTVADAVRPDPIMLVSEWADEYRELDETSARRGTWQTDFAPHTREPMDRLSRQDRCQLLVLMWAAQTAKSSVLDNAIGYTIHTSPRPIMMVQPTIDDAKNYGRLRLTPMFNLCPELSRRVTENVSRGDGNTLQLKLFPGGFLNLSGANSARSLRARSVALLLLDEVDGYVDDVDGEGDPVDLARKRTTTFEPNDKTAITSTPTVKDLSRVEKGYEQTDQNEWWVPCPHCGERQVLRWRIKDGPRKGEYLVVWPKGDPDAAVYVCEHNGCVIRNHERVVATRLGEWRANCPEKSRGGRVRGYHFSAVASPFVSLAKLAEEWEDAAGDPARLKVFVNTRLGETWDDSLGGALKADGLLARREPYVVAPSGVLVVTASIDTQDDRLELHLIGWGADLEAWALDHVVLAGDPSGPGVWAAADAHLLRRILTTDGRTLLVRAACVDYGGHHGNQVVRFCAPRHGRHVWAIKGLPNPSSPIWPKKPGKIGRDKAKKTPGFPLYGVGVSNAKSDIAARLRRTAAGPGCMHFPERFPSGIECDTSYFEQLTSEKLVREGGKLKWKKRHEGARNEVWDLWVYAYAALHGLLRLGLKLPKWKPPDGATPTPEDTPPMPPEPPPTRPAPASRPAAPRRDSWLSRDRVRPPRGWLKR